MSCLLIVLIQVLPYTLYIGVVAGRAQKRGVERAWLLQVHSLPDQGRISLPTDDVESGNTASVSGETAAQ